MVLKIYLFHLWFALWRRYGTDKADFLFKHNTCRCIGVLVIKLHLCILSQRKRASDTHCMGPLGGLHAISVHETDEKSSSWNWNWSLIIQSVTVQFVHWNVVAHIFIDTQTDFSGSSQNSMWMMRKVWAIHLLSYMFGHFNSGLLRLMTGVEPLS